jgi:hypothetical protein
MRGTDFKQSNYKNKGTIMAKKEGWVKFYRTTRDHWLWQDKPFSKGQAWADLILGANHAPAKFLLKGELVKVQRGQQARAQTTLAKEWGWSRGKVERFLERLENEAMIVYKTSHLTTIISICNYSEFQDLYTSNKTTDGQQTDSTQDKNKNKQRIKENVNQEAGRSYAQENVIALFISQRLQEQDRLINKKPDLEKWTSDIVNLMDEQKTNDYQEIIELFEWANKHSFWGTKILSPSGLAKHYQMLEKQRSQRPYLKLPDDLNKLKDFAQANNLPEPQTGVDNKQYKRALNTFIRENAIFEGGKRV